TAQADGGDGEGKQPDGGASHCANIETNYCRPDGGECDSRQGRANSSDSKRAFQIVRAGLALEDNLRGGVLWYIPSRERSDIQLTWRQVTCEPLNASKYISKRVLCGYSRQRSRCFSCFRSA